VRFRSDFDFYCRVLGRSVHVRSWDRLIRDLGLEDSDFVTRRQRVRAIAEIRKVKPFSPASDTIADSFNALKCLKDSIGSDDGLTGRQVYDLAHQVKDVSFRQVQRWGEPHGLRLAATHCYQGQKLRDWLEVIIRNASSVRAKSNVEKVVEILNHESN